MVFYSRYYIQEMLLVFFTLAALGCGWRYFRTRRFAWILGLGASIGMMHATKETWILSGQQPSWPPANLGYVLLPFAPRKNAPLAERKATLAATLLHLFACVLVACFVATALYSNFGKTWHAPWDSILAYGNYFRRGTQGAGHSEPWYYYLQILFACRPIKQFFWSEGLIPLLAIVGGASIRCWEPGNHKRSSAAVHFLTFYTLVLIMLDTRSATKLLGAH